MTTIEHALLGANLVLASGIDKKFGWQAVALAGLCAVAPDWDGLTILWSVPLFDAAHRVWGHNLLVCSLVGLVLAALDYRFDFITGAARRLVRWTKFDGGDVYEIPGARCAAKTQAGFLAVWIVVALVASWSHLVADMVFSGTATFSDWGVKLFWPFSDREFVYPLISWGDPGVTIIFALGMFAMLRWKNHVQTIAVLSLLIATAYVVLL